MTNKIQEAITKFVSEIFGEENVFLMGSRFFGLNADNSDYDFLVFVSEGNDVLEQYKTELFYLGMTEVNTTNYTKLSAIPEFNRLKSTHYEIGDPIDLIVVNNWEYFEQVIKEHEMVLTYIRERNLISILRRLKPHISGKDLYRAVRTELLCPTS